MKIISLSTRGSYTTKMKCPGMPWAPLKVAGLSEPGDKAASQTALSLSGG